MIITDDFFQTDGEDDRTRRDLHHDWLCSLNFSFKLTMLIFSCNTHSTRYYNYFSIYCCTETVITKQVSVVGQFRVQVNQHASFKNYFNCAK